MIKFELDNHEAANILRNGSTNQRYFINKIDSLKISYDIFEELDIIFNEYGGLDLRDLLNGGVLKIFEPEEEPEEEKEYYEDYKILEFETIWILLL